MDEGASASGAVPADAPGLGASRSGGPGSGGTGSTAALVVTTVGRAPFAVVTVRSVNHHHPEMPVTVVVVDDRYGEVTRATTAEPGVWASAAALVGLDRVHELLAEHHPDAACTVLQPTIVSRLLTASDLDSVLLIADHVVLTRPLSSFLRVAKSASAGFVRVRHAPPPVDGRLPDAASLRQHGQLQRGLAVFTRQGSNLVSGWAEGLAHHPLEGEGRFDRIGHPWFDDLSLQARHDVHLADPDLFGSFRNIDELSRTTLPAALSFEGFDPFRPWILSAEGGEWPRVLLSAHNELQDAAERYAAQVNSADAAMPRVSEPFNTLANGHPYDAAMRHLYTSTLHHSLRHGSELPPQPFSELDAFVAFLSSPAPERPGITRHLHALATLRPDLAATFTQDDAAFLRWAATDAVTAGIWTPLPPRVDTSLAPSPNTIGPNHTVTEAAEEAQPVQREAYGLNVVGLLSAQLGIGEQGRLALRAIADSSIPYSVIDHDATVHARIAEVIAEHPADGFRYDIDVLLLNADQTESTLQRFGRPGRMGRPTVGLWAWESPVFPERFHPAFDHVSEVWVATAYIRDTLQPCADGAGVDVEVIPLQFPYVAPRESHADPAGLQSLGIDPARPYFTFLFDYFSVAERKQPWAAIEAFRRAFPHPSPNGPQFVIKSLNHEFFPLDRERLVRATRGRPDVIVVEQYLPPSLRTTLVASASGYVSLHRAEGLGLTMAEAMGAGVPVVATGWSGNTEFMTRNNSWLVDYELVPIPRTVAHYGGAGMWAEPSIDQAADHLARIVEDPSAALARAEQAIVDLSARNSSGADAAFVVERIRRLRSKSGR